MGGTVHRSYIGKCTRLVMGCHAIKQPSATSHAVRVSVQLIQSIYREGACRAMSLILCIVMHDENMKMLSK